MFAKLREFLALVTDVRGVESAKDNHERRLGALERAVAAIQATPAPSNDETWTVYSGNQTLTGVSPGKYMFTAGGSSSAALGLSEAVGSAWEFWFSNTGTEGNITIAGATDFRWNDTSQGQTLALNGDYNNGGNTPNRVKIVKSSSAIYTVHFVTVPNSNG